MLARVALLAADHSSDFAVDPEKQNLLRRPLGMSLPQVRLLLVGSKYMQD